jgi:hypothetical protein
MEPTATYLASVPNFTDVTFPAKDTTTKNVNFQAEGTHDIGEEQAYVRPVPDRSGNVLTRFHSDLTLATW